MTDDSTHSASADQFDADLAALAELLDAAGIEADATHAIAPRDPSAPVPASFAQELLWLLDRATPGLTAYNVPISRRLRGALDVAALEQAVTFVATRHEALRTRFADVDGHAQQIIDAPAPVAMTVVDVSAEPVETREAAASRVARDRARTPFDLAHDRPFRATLVRLAPDDHVLVLESHHIVVDGLSLGIIFRELADAYAAARNGRTPSLPAPAIQYGDYAIWQRQQLAGPRLEELLTFWRGQLGDAREPLGLPTDFARPQVPTFSGARETIVLDAASLADVRRLAHAHDATLYMVLLAAYATVLHRYTGRENVLVGSGSAGRTLPETEGMVGYLNNTLVQRADFSGDPTFGELLGRVRDSALGAYDHQDIPLEKLILELRQGDERLSHAPLFEVVLTMQDTGGGPLGFEGLEATAFGADLGATKFDITLFPSERDGELAITTQYRSDLFAPATMQRFLGHLRGVLADAAARPSTRVSALELMTPDERAQVTEWNDAARDFGPRESVVALFEAQVDRVPARVALLGGRTLTYSELDARANQFAHHLQANGVEHGARVGLLLDRSADAVVGVLGILKAGAAYVPLSVDAPTARLAQQLGECGARIVVTDAERAGAVPATTQSIALDRDASDIAARPDTRLARSATPDDLAYVLFTSGSTGTPKGVAVTHANVVHYTRAVADVLGPGLAALDGLHFGLASTLAADLGNTSLFPSLLAGGTLHVLSKDVATEPARFAEHVAIHPLDVLKITPSHLMALATGRTGSELASLLPRRWIVVGGEALRFDVARTLIGAHKCRVLNHYGPTETTVGACTFEATAESLGEVEALGAQTVPIGRPLPNVTLHVLDGHGNEQPIGVPGELVIGGEGVTNGYLGRGDLTRERFQTWSLDSSRPPKDRSEAALMNQAPTYRTGDRVRRLSNGTVEFLGRADDQVKIRGHRVELGEIEHVLAQHPGVGQSVVVARAEDSGENALVAYVVTKAAGYAVSHSDRPTSERLSEWAAASLPAYMVPSAVVVLEQLPLTPNGKVDRAKLPSPDATASTAADAYVAPRTETETQVAAIWADVLKKERVGTTDNFLALGGHSLMAIRVLGRISKAFGVRLPLRTLFDAPDVARLAEMIDAERAAAPVAAPSGSSIGGIGARSRDAYRIGTTTPSGESGGGSGGAS